MARPPSADSILKNMKKQKFEPKTPIASEMFVPNHSGDLSAGDILTTPVNENDPVNKAYVDSVAGRSSIDLFISKNGSDIGGYFDLEANVDITAEQNIVQSITGNSTTLIASFASILNEEEIDAIELLESGIYEMHIHAKGASAKDLHIYYEFYKRAAGGTETLLGTSHDSGILTTTDTNYALHANITDDTAWISGDRVVVKVYGRNDGAAAKNITIYMEGTTAARVVFPGVIPRMIITTYDTGWINRSDWTNVHIGSDDTLNADSNVTHNLGAPLSDVLVKFLISTDGTDANSSEINEGWGYDGVFFHGFTLYAVDDDNIKVQTGSAGVARVADNGAPQTIDTENWYYKIKVFKLT